MKQWQKLMEDKISGLGLTQNDDENHWLVSEAQEAFPVIGKLLHKEPTHQILSFKKRVEKQREIHPGGGRVTHAIMSYGCNRDKNVVWVTALLLNGFPLVESSFRQAPLCIQWCKNGHVLRCTSLPTLRLKRLAVFSEQLWLRFSCPGFIYRRTILATGHLCRRYLITSSLHTGRLISMHLI